MKMISNTEKKQRMRLDVFFFGTKTGSLTCVWWVSLTERLQTGAVSLQKPTIIWLFQDLGKLPSQLAKHRFNHKAAVILACVASVSNRVIARTLEQEPTKKGVPSAPPPSFLFSFALVPTFSTNSRGNACYAGYSDLERQTFAPKSTCERGKSREREFSSLWFVPSFPIPEPKAMFSVTISNRA